MRLFFFTLLLCCSALTYASVPPTVKFIQVENYNQLRVGDSIERLTEIPKERRRWGTPSHRAKFYFYLLRADLPARCLNLQCGHFARKIISNDGFLVGGADQAFAKEVGLNFKSQDTDPSQSLLIVTDREGIVTALYENVSNESLSEIVSSTVSDQNR